MCKIVSLSEKVFVYFLLLEAVFQKFSHILQMRIFNRFPLAAVPFRHFFRLFFLNSILAGKLLFQCARINFFQRFKTDGTQHTWIGKLPRIIFPNKTTSVHIYVILHITDHSPASPVRIHILIQSTHGWRMPMNNNDIFLSVYIV